LTSEIEEGVVVNVASGSRVDSPSRTLVVKKASNAAGVFVGMLFGGVQWNEFFGSCINLGNDEAFDFVNREVG
jgi:hypothetical protein